MARKSLHVNWREGNAIDLLQNGAEFFPALCQAIDAAHSTVHLETYIFNLDDTGRQVLDALQRASRRGVRVRVVIDGYGSQAHADSIAQSLHDAGARCRIYRPRPKGWVRQRFTLRRLRRLHRKTAVIDRRIGFVGGINILDDYFDVPDNSKGPMPRFDFAVCVQGPVVADLIRMQDALWLRMAWRRRDDWGIFQERFGRWANRHQQYILQILPTIEQGLKAALLLRDNVFFRQKIEKVYLSAMALAQDEIVIANAYFFPGRKIRTALAHAARRGVKVTLMLQGQPEYPIQYRASRSMYAQLLSDGIALYEYQPSYLHAKVAVIDQCAMVGSANLDPFSSLLAREANIWVSNPDFAVTLKSILDEELRSSCARITERHVRRHTWWARIVDGVAYRVLRAGVALTGKSSDY